jgi:potassium-transporting ATPase potassium-binding subunit
MRAYEIAQLAIVIAAACTAAPFLGKYMAELYSGRLRIPRALARLENSFYRAVGADPEASMDWKAYALALLAFSGASIALLFLILIGQGILPFNPRSLPGLKWDLALNTAVSFVTNTNWQAYSGEASLSYFSQATALAVQNFLSAAAGMSVAVAIARGIAARRSAEGSAPAGIGNFWVDMTRSVLYILLPLSIVLAVALASQGVVQSLADYVPAVSLEGKEGLIPLGPAASQVAIKHLGTNGGGFFGPNSAFPFENPTVASDLLEKTALILIPFAFPFLFGRMVGSRRHGRAIFMVMLSLLAIAVAGSLWSELRWGTMEGKELRFGKAGSALFSVLTTVTSSGAVNAMHDSLSPLAGMVAMFDIMIGEVIFGGVGSGLYGMIALVLITVFIAGLMVGRSPEYLGKRIEAREVQLSMVAIIVPNFLILALGAVAVSMPAGLSSLANRGPHGLSEILYAYSSGAGNNGSAFGGLAANTVFYNMTIATAMLLGRFGVMIPMLGVGGSLAARRTVAQGIGSLRIDTFVFAGLLFAVVVIVAGLTHFPALTLGPILEHFLMTGGARL